jgi:hypothetical protein
MSSRKPLFEVSTNGAGLAGLNIVGADVTGDTIGEYKILLPEAGAMFIGSGENSSSIRFWFNAAWLATLDALDAVGVAAAVKPGINFDNAETMILPEPAAVNALLAALLPGTNTGAVTGAVVRFEYK